MSFRAGLFPTRNPCPQTKSRSNQFKLRLQNTMDSGSASRYERQYLAEFISATKSGSYPATARNDIAVGDSFKRIIL